MSVAAIVKFVPEGVNVTLLPATNLMSCVPEEAPDFVNLNIQSFEESTNDDVNTFCVFVSVLVSVGTAQEKVPSPSDLKNCELVPLPETSNSSAPIVLSVTSTVTVLVLPTTVVIESPPAISSVSPWLIVWFVPLSAVSVKVVN